MNGIGEDDRGMYIDMGKIMTKQNVDDDDDDDDEDDDGGSGGVKVVRRWRREIWREAGYDVSRRQAKVGRVEVGRGRNGTKRDH